MIRKTSFVAAMAGLVLLAAATGAAAKSIKDVHGFEPHFVLPPGTTMVSVKDLGAVGDGKTDDTEAFKKAICGDSPRSIYIPAGTYLIREQLRYGANAGKKKRTLLIGESVSSAVIKLADKAPGFGDPAKPQTFIYTRHPKQQGEQNMNMFLYHLTIEIGRGNGGAVALNYHSNNTGAIKDVVLRASDPVGSPGHTGLACWDWEVGDAIACYLTVDGFKTGVSLTRIGNYFTMEHVTVRRCATGVEGPTFCIRDLVTENCGVALRSTGQTVLVDAVLKGSGPAAIVNEKGGLLARNITTAGYATAIASQSPGGNAKGPEVREYLSDKPVSNWPPAPGMGTTLNLPIEDSPELQYPQTGAEWAVMPAQGDISDALQQAIDAGKKTIYIPAGGVSITRTIILRKAVERIMCAGVAMVTCKTGDEPIFRLEGGTAPVVIVELFYTNYGSKTGPGVLQASPRTLVVRHGSLSYETAPEGAGGKFFAESLVSYITCRKVHAWLRDMDTESGGPQARNLANEGGVMWVLGQKTEDFATKIRTVDGFTELLGGTYRQNWDASDFQRTGIDPNDPPPLFEAVNSNVSYTYVSWGPAKAYVHLVRETRGSETRNLERSQAGGGAVLFVGYTKRPAP